MAVTIGATGSVAWAGGGVNGQLAATGATAKEWSLDLEAAEFDATVLGNTGAMTAIPGLQSWSGSFKSILVVPGHGNGGLVTFAAGYAVNINAWNMTINRTEIDATVFNATSPTVRSWIPGLFKWGGAFSGFLDGTTVAVFPGGNAVEPAAATFRYQEKGATDNTFAGSILTTRTGIGVQPNTANTVSYTYSGTGDVTQSTPSAGAGVIPAGALGLTAASSITLTSSTSRTFVGSAFWRSIAISVQVGGLIEVEVGFRGDGALVIS